MNNDLEIGDWKLEVGSWKLEVGSWKLEVGGKIFKRGEGEHQKKSGGGD